MSPVDLRRPHVHVFVREDEETRTVRTAQEARLLRKQLQDAGLHPFIEPCSGSCSPPIDRLHASREEFPCG
jgi:hypothetical protein